MSDVIYEGEKWDQTKKAIKTGYDKTKKHLKKNWREYALGAHLWNTGEILDSKSYMDLFQ